MPSGKVSSSKDGLRVGNDLQELPLSLTDKSL